LATNYENSFQGRYFGDKSKVKVIAIQPTAAYKITPELSIGLGVPSASLKAYYRLTLLHYQILLKLMVMIFLTAIT
jgi:long-subunit fatty acid transport protein